MYLQTTDPEYLIIAAAIAMGSALRIEKAAIRMFGWAHASTEEIDAILDAIEGDLAIPDLGTLAAGQEDR